MSIKARRVDKKIYGRDGASFNLYGDKLLCEWLDQNSEGGFYNKLNDDGAGEVEFSVEEIEEAIKSCILEVEVRDSLAIDVAWAKKNNRDYLTYDCY